MKVATTTTKSTLVYNSSLSRREVALLAGWERERRAFVTLDDIRRMVGVVVARDVASRLVAKKALERIGDRKSTRLNSSHSQISYAVFCLNKKKVRRVISGM